jgi:hypothetical protein
MSDIDSETLSGVGEQQSRGRQSSSMNMQNSVPQVQHLTVVNPTIHVRNQTSIPEAYHLIGLKIMGHGLSE